MDLLCYCFEQNHEHRLSADYRPAIFDGWMKSYRVLDKKKIPLSLVDIERSFFTEYREWWSSLQPFWCSMVHSTLFPKIPPSHLDWSKLCCSGPNGIALIVIALTWMSFFIDPDHALFPDFSTYAEEATWACGQMISWIEAGRPSVPTK
jgi:hypothetical protein